VSGSGTSSRNLVRTLATQLASWTLTFLVVRYVPAYLRGSGYAALGIASAFAAAFAQLVGLVTLGKTVSVEQASVMSRLAVKHGFKLGGFRSFEQAVTEETVAAVRRAAGR